MMHVNGLVDGPFFLFSKSKSFFKWATLKALVKLNNLLETPKSITDEDLQHDVVKSIYI